LNPSSHDVIICDSRFEESIRSCGIEKLIPVVAEEKNKCLSTVERLMIELQGFGLNRNSTIIAVGGGIIQDLATLSASLFMRGVEWIYFPTTLLGMADSCIGGKSSINAGEIKNLVGNIYPPKRIIIDSHFIESLSDVDVAAGLTEAVKISFCKGAAEFLKFIDLCSGNSIANYPVLLQHVLGTKKWFIEVDEFDKKERQLLNFGHTFGHALEVATHHQVPHGIAVGIGMKAALAFESKNRALSLEESKLKEFINGLFDGLVDLPSILSTIDWKLFDRAFDGDKKHKLDSYQLILPTAGGGVRMQQLSKTEATKNLVREALIDSMNGV
jgi:3-dehydroquinate synthase